MIENLIGTPDVARRDAHGYDDFADGDGGLDLSLLLRPAIGRWKTIMAAALLAGIAGYAVTFSLTPRFSAHTVFIPPQQQQSGAASALASLGALGGLSGASGIRNPAEQFMSLMQSEAVTDRLIDRFQLMKVYGATLREPTRRRLLSRTTISAGKKDGLITVVVEDTDRKRAAAMANQYVEELRHLTATLAVSEAQQRRVFFQGQMEDARNKLVAAQSALQQSGFNQGALNVEPSTAASGYARLRADLAAAKVRLETMQGNLAPTAPEVLQQSAAVRAIEGQLHQLEGTVATGANNPDYVSKYREFKFEETVFDLMAKQYEIAKVDESHEGALIQVVDVAREAEQKSWPHRIQFAGAGFAGGLLLASLFFIGRGRRAARTAS